jgi:hypothetical protein
MAGDASEATGRRRKFTNEVLHSHVRNIQINQSVFQRLMHVGSIGISTSGQAGIEIFIRGIPNPYDLKNVIDQYRFGESALSTGANADAEQYQRQRWSNPYQGHEHPPQDS